MCGSWINGLASLGIATSGVETLISPDTTAIHACDSSLTSLHPLPERGAYEATLSGSPTQMRMLVEEGKERAKRWIIRAYFIPERDTHM